MAGEKTDFSQELWAAFRSGFPIENLRPFLVSGNQEVVSLGSYLIYELGATARCLLDDIVPLLKNDDPQVRGSTIVALGECATKFDFLALGKVIEMLNDHEPFVQRITMRFIQSCERSMLNVGVVEAAKMNPSTVFSDFPSYLGNSALGLGRVIPISAENLRKLLSHTDLVANRFGVALATRPRMIVDEAFISLATKVDDEECQNIVKWSRERPCLTYAEIMKL